MPDPIEAVTRNKSKAKNKRKTGNNNKKFQAATKVKKPEKKQSRTGTALSPQTKPWFRPPLIKET
jgi:hypothetical protein